MKWTVAMVRSTCILRKAGEKWEVVVFRVADLRDTSEVR